MIRENEERRKRMKLAQDSIKGENGEGFVSAVTEEEEEVITKDLQEIEDKLERAEKRIEKTHKKLEKKKITQEEHDREISHLNRVIASLEKKQQKLWDSKM